MSRWCRSRWKHSPHLLHGIEVIGGGVGPIDIDLLLLAVRKHPRQRPRFWNLECHVLDQILIFVLKQSDLSLVACQLARGPHTQYGRCGRDELIHRREISGLIEWSGPNFQYHDLLKALATLLVIEDHLQPVDRRPD